MTGSSFGSHPPVHVAFGQKYEDKARQQFLKSHKYHHRKCSIDTPGLIVSHSHPFLGASPDGILTCSKCPDQALIEIKCLSSKRNFQPGTALVLSKVCTKKSDGSLEIRKNHTYYTQIQGQMAITGIHSSWLVAYTHKGISAVHVAYDPEFCAQMISTLQTFYSETMIPMFRAGRVL